MSDPIYAVYARPIDVKSQLDIADMVDDSLLLNLCVWARSQIDTITHRHFWPQVATKLYDYQHAYELLLNHDLISITTLTNGDDSTISSDDYYLYPHSGPPYYLIEIDTGSSEAFTYSSSKQQCISVAGVWGWDEITVGSGATVGSSYSADGTSLTVSDGAPFNLGDLLKIGTDYLYVTKIQGNTLSVQPGVNGATSADHAGSAAISFVRFPDEITHIARRLVHWRFRQKDASFDQIANVAMGTLVVPSQLPADVLYDLRRWSRRSVH